MGVGQSVNFTDSITECKWIFFFKPSQLGFSVLFKLFLNFPIFKNCPAIFRNLPFCSRKKASISQPPFHRLLFYWWWCPWRWSARATFSRTWRRTPTRSRPSAATPAPRICTGTCWRWSSGCLGPETGHCCTSTWRRWWSGCSGAGWTFWCIWNTSPTLMRHPTGERLAPSPLSVDGPKSLFGLNDGNSSLKPSKSEK